MSLGNVANAAPSTVLPASLSRAFTHTREHPAIDNEYRNGESQRQLLSIDVVKTSRKHWRLAKRLTPTQLSALRDFYDARRGSLEPFYFYDPHETNPRFTTDPTGVDANGRYIVRFDCDWQQATGPARSDVEIALIELA